MRTQNIGNPTWGARTVLGSLIAWFAGLISSTVAASALAAGASAIDPPAPAGRQPWPYSAIEKPEPPSQDDPWSQSALDRFVYQRLLQGGLRPAPRAKPTVLLRRLYFDLLGLPPSPTEVDAFRALVDDDGFERAWAAQVDTLLADSRHGEHWAQFWLDLVRYAESDGWNQDAYRSDMWRYRDYVVRAFNDDKPYPLFIREQLAGDEIASDDPAPRIAAGFLRLGIYEYNQRDARTHWKHIVDEMTDVVGDAFLGVGMACAKCHDHKFDPISQDDYFRLRAFFEPLVWRDDLTAATAAQRAAHQKQLADWQAATDDIRAHIDALIKPYHDAKWEWTVDRFPLDIQACFHKPVAQRNSWEHQMAYFVVRQFDEEGGGPLKDMTDDDKRRHAELQQELAAFDDLKPPPLPRMMTVADFDGPLAPPELLPGSDEPIRPAFPAVLASSIDSPTPVTPLPRSTGRRTALASWIGRPDNPLTMRVIVNRIWQQHFGRGIVASANDFGSQGTSATHPEMLDYLAATFIEQGFRFKELHRQILNSAVWQQSSTHPDAPRCAEADPENGLYWRAPIRRLKAEQVHDAMLVVSGELDDELGGPSVDASAKRRAVYIKRLRNSPEPLLGAFDAAGGLKSVCERNHTTTPTQALLMINGEFALARADAMAARLARLNFASPANLATFACRLAWCRPPDDDELDAAVEFLTNATESSGTAEQRAPLVDFCHVLLNTNEFLYVD